MLKYTCVVYLFVFTGRIGVFYGNKTNFPLVNFNAVIKLEGSLTKNILCFVCIHLPNRDELHVLCICTVKPLIIIRTQYIDPSINERGSIVPTEKCQYFERELPLYIRLHNIISQFLVQPSFKK